MSQPKAWKCEVCGYVHEGDAPPDTCPVCGVGPDMFSAFEVVGAQPAVTSSAWRCTICDYMAEGDAPPERCPVCGAEQSLFEPHDAGDAQSAADAGVKRLVIVGAGVAGVTAAEQARRASADVAITLVSGEAERPYYRINLTRFLAGEIGDTDLALHPDAWYGEHQVEQVAGEVSAILRDDKKVQLRDGETLEYDRLILANGAHPFIPPLTGATKAGVHALRTLADARALLEGAQADSHCVCLGGGVLGLEAAGALARHGVKVTVLEGFGWLLPRQLAKPAADLLQQHLEAQGMHIMCDVRAEEVVGDEAARAVRLAGGEEIACDMVVVATGVRPNSYLARLSGLEVNHGVVVDDRMVTSDPAILAAGDVAEHRGVVYGLWPSAYAQGLIAGANALGGAMEFTGMPPSNRLKVLDVDLYSIGVFQPEDGSYTVLEESGEGTYVRLVCRDGQVVGANLYGDTGLAGEVKSAVEEGTQILELNQLQQRFPKLQQHCVQGD